MEKHKFASISSTVRGRAILSKFSPHRVYNQCTLGNFQKFFLSSKMAAILNFRQKMQKHKFASISLTVRDFRPTGYLSNVLLRIFQKVFPLLKNAKTQICLYLLNRARFSTHRVFKQCTFENFPKSFSSPQKWRPF